MDNKIARMSVYQPTVEIHGRQQGGRSAPFMNRLVSAFSSFSCHCCTTDDVKYVAAGESLVDRLKSFPSVKAVIIDLLYLSDVVTDSNDIEKIDDAIREKLVELKTAICTPSVAKVSPDKSMSNTLLKKRLQFDHEITEALEQIFNTINPEQPNLSRETTPLSIVASEEQVDEVITSMHTNLIEKALQKRNTAKVVECYKKAQQEKS